MNKILEVRNLSKIYGPGCPLCFESTGPEADTNLCPNCASVIAIHDVSFDLFEGEILGVMGESGSGKSTVVKSLYFDQAPSSGEAIFYDRDKQHDLFSLNAAQQRWLRKAIRPPRPRQPARRDGSAISPTWRCLR